MTCSDHIESWSWPRRGSIGILASSLVAMPPRQRGPSGGDEMIAAIYAHVTPRKQRERLAEYLK